MPSSDGGTCWNGRTVCWNERHELGCDDGAPSEARQFCSEVIRSCLGAGAWVQPLEDDAALVASELVTNSVHADCRRVWVALTVHRSHVHLSVYDDAAGLPHIIDATPLATNGRGLTITQGIASSWGVDAQPPGKQVWADLVMPPDGSVTSELWCLELDPRAGNGARPTGRQAADLES